MTRNTPRPVHIEDGYYYFQVIVGVMDDSLRYLLAIVEHGSLSKAADSLFISQPALSRFLGRLERSLGVELIDRSSHPLTLTPEGQRYRDYLQGVEQLRTAMEADLEGMAEAEAESVRLGATVWRSATILSYAIPRVLADIPDLRITLFEGSNSQLHASLKAKKLDLAVMNSTQTGAGIHFSPAISERVVLTGLALSDIADTQDGKIAEVSSHKVRPLLQNSRILLLHPEHHMGAVSRDFLASIGVRHLRVMSSHNIVTAVRLAALGAGIAFAPEGAARGSGAPYVYVRHSGMLQNVGLAWPADSPPRGGLAKLANSLRDEIQNPSNLSLLL